MHRIRDGGKQQDLSLLQVVLEYHRRGWSIIPIRPGTKKAACKWEQFQSVQPSEATLKKWFAENPAYGLAVILGAASGGLVCRDFDTMEAYERWARTHPDLARTLPTVATARGRHVYFGGTERTITKMADGELRGAGYCLLPPSRHPDGPVYTWLIPLPAGPLPFVEDVHAARFFDSAPHATETTERTEDNRGLLRKTEAIGTFGFFAATTQDKKGPVPSSTEIEPDIERAILASLPTGPGRRNRQVFELARALKAIPRLADAPVDTLEPLVRRWHHVGVTKKVIATEPFEETWIDLLRAWPKVRFPKGAEPMAAIFEQSKQEPLPRAAQKYERPEFRLLVGLCRELQRASGDEPFFLACRTAGRLLGVRHETAWRWLFLLDHDGVIKEVEKGDGARRRASRFRYLAD